jgi:hypothetical protein
MSYVHFNIWNLLNKAAAGLEEDGIKTLIEALPTCLQSLPSLFGLTDTFMGMS